MSAYVQCKSHIDYIVAALIRRGLVKPDQADEAGRILWLEQVASVRYRYPSDGPTELPGHIDFNADVTPWEYHYAQPGRVPTPIEELCASRGYQYQACEHPQWQESQAYRWAQALDAACEADGAKATYPDEPGQFMRGQSTPEWSAAGTWEICTCADDEEFAAIVADLAPVE